MSATARACETCGQPCRRRFCSAACHAASREHTAEKPTPAEIAERAAEIRAEWSDEVRIERMRPDFRPVPWVAREVGSDF